VTDLAPLGVLPLFGVVVIVVLVWPVALAATVLQLVAGRRSGPGARCAPLARRLLEGPADATVHCTRCGREEDVVLARAVTGGGDGPPTCCGDTMRLVRRAG
jgi:hypothetical protein